MDVLAAQIAVAIEDVAIPSASIKKLSVTIVKETSKIPDRFECRARKERADEPFGLRKILISADPKLCDASPLRDPGGGFLRPIKFTELLRYPVQVH